MMAIRAKIQSYSNARTDGLYDAMLAYLEAHRAVLKRAIAITEQQTKQVQLERDTYRKQYRKDNPHLVGSGGYTHTGIVMKAA